MKVPSKKLFVKLKKVDYKDLKDGDLYTVPSTKHVWMVNHRDKDKGGSTYWCIVGNHGGKHGISLKNTNHRYEYPNNGELTYVLYIGNICDIAENLLNKVEFITDEER